MKISLKKASVFKVLVAAIAILTVMLIAPQVKTRAAEGEYLQDEARSMIDEINEFRHSSEAWYWNEDDSAKVTCSGLGDLIYDVELEKVAMLRAKEIAESFSHTRPNGESCFTAYDDCGYNWQITVGENIAYGQPTAHSVYMAWREDDYKYAGQGHRRNMLNSQFKAIGIGCYSVNGRKYWVQEFAGNTPTVTLTPSPEPTANVTATPDPTKEVTPEPTKEVTPEPTKEPAKKSLASVSFSFTDIRTGKTVNFKGNDGVPKVIVLGGLGSCYNTISAMKSFTSLMPKIDGDFELYALDIKDNSEDSILNWLADDGIISSAHIASINNISGSSYWGLYQYGQDAIEAAGDNWLMPMVLYIDGNGNLSSATVNFQSKDVIESELGKIVKFGKAVTPEPTKEITPEPTKVVTPEPTKEITPVPTVVVTPEPTKEITPEPTKEITPAPTQGAKANGTFSGTTFEMTDVLTGSKATFDGGDGKAKIILFGDLSSCWNTLDIVDSFGYGMSYIDYDVKIYLIDTKNSKDSNLKTWLNYANINDSMFASAEKKVKATGDMTVEEIKKTILSAAGVKAKGKRYNFVSPALAYIDGNGDIVAATTGYVDYENIIPYMDYLMDKNADISVIHRSGNTETIVENTVKSDTSVVQKVLRTDVMGGKSIDVFKVNKKGKKENTSYTVTGKNTATLMSTITDLTKLTIPSYVKIGGKKYYVTVVDQPGNPQLSKVTQVTIGSKVKKLTANAFKSVNKLSVVNITAGKLKTIEKGAFSMTDENTVFNIKGSKNQFEKVKKLLIASGVSEKATFINK